MLRVTPKIVDRSNLSLQLEMLLKLETFLDQVKQYKAIRKLDDLLYKPLPEGSSKYANRHHFEQRKTAFGFFISDRYGRTQFSFYENPKPGMETRVEFDIAAKTIPDIIAAASEYKAWLLQWIEKENDQEAYIHGLTRELEQQFAQEMTRTQFENRKKAYAQLLRELADEVEGLTAK
jgi:hypothetical protein